MLGALGYSCVMPKGSTLPLELELLDEELELLDELEDELELEELLLDDELLEELELDEDDELEELEELLLEDELLEELELDEPLIIPTEAPSNTQSILEPSSRLTIRSVCVPAARLLNVAGVMVP